MRHQTVLEAIDHELALLHQVRSILASDDSEPLKVIEPTTHESKPRRRPPGRPSVGSAKAKRTLSPEARERIATAQRKRWAAKKEEATA